MKKTAIILGNGDSRKDIDYRKLWPDAVVYGCNGAYREDVDRLVCVDVYMQHLIYESGYCIHNWCYFNQWDPLPKEVVKPIAQSFGLPIIANTGTNRACVRGTDKFVYVTWVEDYDEIRSIPDIEISSGSRALLLAAESGEYDKIILLGFDGITGSNIYINTSGYENSEPRSHWEQERKNIMDRFPDIEFTYENNNNASKTKTKSGAN